MKGTDIINKDYVVVFHDGGNESIDMDNPNRAKPLAKVTCVTRDDLLSLQLYLQKNSMIAYDCKYLSDKIKNKWKDTPLLALEELFDKYPNKTVYSEA